MAQRNSGYERQANEWYPTPRWVVDALAEHVRLPGLSVWEPAAGDGAMAHALVAHGASVWSTDIVADEKAHERARTEALDFLATTRPVGSVDAIITNPPFGPGGSLAVDFASKGLDYMRRRGGSVRLLALLLAVDFDSAKGRAPLFAECPQFAMKIVLRKRIKWFEGPAGPSTNHAWFVWARNDFVNYTWGPVVRYAPALTHFDRALRPEPRPSLADL